MQVLVKMERASGPSQGRLFSKYQLGAEDVVLRANVPELLDPNDGSSPGEDGCGDGEEVIEKAEDTRA